jgi:hypothetical protein
MRLLKFFLWITLLACTAWGAAIFLGPTVISRAVATYFGDAVKVKRLNVSPALEVSAAAIEFDFPARDGAPAVRGVARGVTLGWSFGEVIKLDLGLGPTRVEGLGFVASAGLSLTPNSNFNWAEVRLEGNFEGAGVGPHAAELGRLSADLDAVSQVASGIRFEFERVSALLGGLLANVPAAVVTVSEVKVGAPIAAQISDLDIQLPSGATYAGAHSKSAAGRGRLTGGVIDFEVTGANFAGPAVGIGIENFNVSAAFDVVDQVLGQEVEFELKNINAEVLDGSIETYAGEVTHGGGNFSHAGSGRIASLSLRSGENFIGEVSGAEFKLELAAAGVGAPKTTLRGAAEIGLAPDFDLVVAIDAVTDATAPSECLGGGCALSNVTFKYVASVPEGRLFGSSSCLNSACKLDRFTHTLQTDDTDKFFAGVGAARVFSPLAVPFAYAAMQRGVQNGSGHRLEF